MKAETVVIVPEKRRKRRIDMNVHLSICGEDGGKRKILCSANSV